MQTLFYYSDSRLLLSLSSFRFNTLSSLPIRPFLCFFSSSTPIKNPLVFTYLIKTLSFSEPQALSISNRFPSIRTLQKPHSVVQFLKQLGFSNAQIQSSIQVSPQILCSDVEKTLKPKIQIFQDLGLTGLDLGKFISKSSTLLTISLHKRLIPCIDLLKKILVNDKNNQDLIRVLNRCNWITSKDSQLRLQSNIEYFESHGIVGSQLLMLLKRQPRIFVKQDLTDLFSRVLRMGFSVDSRMLVHAVYTLSCISVETFNRKLELFKSFGFSESECMEMFRKAPGVFRTSEEKLRFGMELFLFHIKFERSVLVNRPSILMHNIEDRVIARYRVLQVMKSKRLLKKEPSFLTVLSLSEEDFQEQFIARFRDDAEELLVAHKGHLLDSSGN